MTSELQFKISSALKNIIGKDLINDDFIAIFELVKNAYDAHASKVELIFEKEGDNFNKIIIKDNGKGMNYDDLVNKWLFVAYSAKKEGTEEDTYGYRDKIKVKRAYAGAKGIGRFSCDRLGARLYLETIKDEYNAKIEAIITDWEKFEEDLSDEFVNISVLHETIDESSYGIKHGTALEITDLRSTWDRDKFLTLKRALAKLINPNRSTEEDSFLITLKVESELEGDLRKKEIGKKNQKTDEAIYNDIVNGDIQNLIFETLNFKTTKIVSEVSETDLNIITTSLYEGGKLVYSIKEHNKLSYLNHVTFSIYYLNQSAKATFSRRMGMQPVDYGHVFVYKNGLRVYPYGERGEDPLKMDNRKAQGRTRYLGTREVIGYIDILGENPGLNETSSRGDGLSKTNAYSELYEWFYITLRKLERYIIEISDWGKDLSDDDFINLDESQKVLALQSLVANLAKSQHVISIEYAPDLFDILEQKEESSAKNVLKDLRSKINKGEIGKEELIKSVSKVEKKIKDLQLLKEEAEAEALGVLIENEHIEKELDAERKKGLWQGALINTDKERIIALQHQIFHSSSRITRNVKLLLKELEVTKLNEKITKKISVISLESSKINSIANFITKANFNLKATEIESDLVDFIIGYLYEIYISDGKIIDSSMVININKDDVERVVKFVPLEVTTLVDIFISNAEKLNSKVIEFNFESRDGKLIITISDDNKIPVPKANFDDVFKFGYTTTNGSGIGLSQAKDIVNRLGGNVSLVESNKETGTKFKLVI